MKPARPWLTLFFCGAALTVCAQDIFIPHHTKFQPAAREYLYSGNTGKFTSVRPYRIKLKALDSLQHNPPQGSTSRRFSRITNGHLLRTSGPDYKVGVSPLADLILYRVNKPDGSDTITNYRNGRGIWLEGVLGEHVWFSSWVMENQAVWPGYLGTYIDEAGIVPGSGRTKPFGDHGVDYAMAGGTIAYNPLKGNLDLMIKAGHDNFFVGDGYRSLLLSDNAFNYPFLNINTTWKNKLRYSNIYAVLQSLDRTPRGNAPEAIFFRKNATFHMLGIRPLNQLEVTLFEGMVWQVYDSITRIPVPGRFYVPVIFLNSVLNRHTEHHALQGINLRYTLMDGFTAYGQLAVNAFKSGETGWQAGLRIDEVIGFSGRIEYNSVPAGFYTHRLPLQSYTHYRQPLAHTLGTGFREFNSAIAYHYRDLFAGLELTAAQYADSSLPGGLNILHDSPPLKPGQQLINLHGYVAWLINRKYNLNLIAGYRNRLWEQGQTSYHHGWLYAGIQTSLRNRYTDF